MFSYIFQIGIYKICSLYNGKNNQHIKMSVLRWRVGWRLLREFQFYGHEMWLFITFNVKKSGTNYVSKLYVKYMPSKHNNFYFGLPMGNFKTSEQVAAPEQNRLTSCLQVSSHRVTHICKHSTVKLMLTHLGKIMELQRLSTWGGIRLIGKK